MNLKYKAKVNNSIEFDFDINDLSKIDLIKKSDSIFHILHNNKSVYSEIVESDFHNKLYKVKVNNTLYNINIYNELDIHIKDMGFDISSSKMIDEIKAPMPGLILEINVKVGQEVKENDALLILEAMKMENVLTSPRSGFIKSISAKKSDAVEKNQLLIEFE